MAHYSGQKPRRVRSVYCSSEGVIYVGAVGEFGYLRADSLGRLVYVSLSDKLKEKDKEFADVWKVLSAGDEIIFTTVDKNIFFQKF